MFIYRTIVAIFAVEAVFLAMAFSTCRSAFLRHLPDSNNPVAITDHCPDLGERAEVLFTAALATTLGLLSAGNTDPVQ